MTNATPVAGWYDDPADQQLMRWWDGTAWSDQVAPHPSPATASSAPGSTPAAQAVAGTDPMPESSAGPDASDAPDESRPSWYVEDGGSHTPAQRATDAVMYRTSDTNAAFPNPFAAGTTGDDRLPSRRELRKQAVEEPLQAAPEPQYVAAPAPTPELSFSAAPPALSGEPAPAAAMPATSAAQPTKPGPGADAAPDPAMWSTPRFAPTPASAAIPDGPRVSPPFDWTASDEAQPDAAPASEPAPAGGWQAPSSFAVPSSASELASADYEPMSRVGSSATVSLRPTRANTVAAWFLAMSPVLGSVAFIGLVFAADWSLRSASATTLWSDPLVAAAIVAGTGLVLSLLVIFAVVADRRRLESLGHGRRASGWWILLGVFPYLLARLVRTRQESGKGAAPLVAHVFVVLLFTSAAIAAPFVVPRDASLAQMRTVEDTITADLATEGTTLSVMCPDAVDARIGAQFVCTAYADDGEVAGLVRAQWVGIDGSVAYSFSAGGQ